MARSMQRSGKSREAIAAEMDSWGGGDPDYPISKAMLDAFVSPTKIHRFPVIYLRSFVVATGQTWLFDGLVSGTGRVVVDQQTMSQSIVGQVEGDIQDTEKKLRELRAIKRSILARGSGR